MSEIMTEDEIQIMEGWHTPRCLLETLFHDFNVFGDFHPTKMAELRTYQLPLISDEPIIDFEATANNYVKEIEKEQGKTLNKEERGKLKFQLRKNVGDIHCYGSRRHGKTLCVEKLDLINSLLMLKEEKMALGSVDLIHLGEVLNDVKDCFDSHPICNLWSKRLRGAPDYNFTFKNHNKLNSVNFNIGSKSPGRQWYGKHCHRIYIEEGCFSGRTRVRCIDKKGNSKTIRLSELTNHNLYKKYKVMSYNINKNKIEYKHIKSPFKKTVKNYTKYKITFKSYDKNTKRVLEASQSQDFYTAKGYINVKNLKVGNKVFLNDYYKLDNIQKQVLVGILLGDAHLTSKNRKYLSLSMCHGKYQKDYLKYKYKIFKPIFKNSYRKKVETNFDTKLTSYNGHVASIKSNTCLDLSEFREFKKNSKIINFKLLDKYFSDISLAFWIMDDGSLQYPRGKTYKANKALILHTEGFNKDTVEKLSNFLNKKYKINTKVRKSRKYFIIYVNAKDTIKIAEKVKNYIYPYFYYKIYHPSELCKMILNKKFIKFNDLSLNIKDLLEESEILNIEKIKSKQWTMYDIEVEDNHNFFANGILVHNSLETDEVYNLRQDAISEVGAVLRCSGMSNFTPNSPAGRAFYNEDREHVVNYPQYVNPFWNEAEKQKRLEQFGGQDSVGYKVYVKGEIVEDSSTTFDMNRIEKQCYIGGKNPPDIERFEISKDNFKNFKNLIVLERPKNVDRLFLSSDIGEKVTEIVIHSEKNNKYYYRYNIVLYNLTHIEQLEVFRHIIDKLETEVIAIDCGDGEGRVIYRELEKLYSKENMVWYDGSRKIDVDIETDEKGNLIYEKGKPKYKQEYMAQWSVTRLQHLLYNGKFRIPKDFKFHSQFSVVVSMVSGTRTKYKCVSQTGDHLFDAWKVFAIAQWRKHDFNQTQRPKRKKSIGVVSW